jgi:hypothetical protein
MGARLLFSKDECHQKIGWKRWRRRGKSQSSQQSRKLEATGSSKKSIERTSKMGAKAKSRGICPRTRKKAAGIRQRANRTTAERKAIQGRPSEWENVPSSMPFEGRQSRCPMAKHFLRFPPYIQSTQTGLNTFNSSSYSMGANRHGLPQSSLAFFSTRQLESQSF